MQIENMDTQTWFDENENIRRLKLDIKIEDGCRPYKEDHELLMDAIWMALETFDAKKYKTK